MSSSLVTVGLAVALGGVVAYLAYYDYNRRNAPDYVEQVKARK